MAHPSIRNRIQKIQSHLGVKADGIVGPGTLTALENALFGEKDQHQAPGLIPEPNPDQLLVSQKGIGMIVSFEISSKAYYQKFLLAPSWPGSASGVTIGIGYDLGYHTQNQIQSDWGGRVSGKDLDQLVSLAGTTGARAKEAVQGLSDIRIPYDAACDVFYSSSLAKTAVKVRKAYPGVQDLFPDAQAAMLSLVYNRGTAMAGPSRREMAALKALVAVADYAGMAEQFLSMKRLWEGKGLPGLLKRRDQEARLIQGSDRDYESDQLVMI